MGENLAVWREQLVEAKWGDMDNYAVYLGWDADSAATTARYAVQLPERGLTLTQNSVLVFSLADANEAPTPETKDTGKKGEHEPIDLTVEVVDGAGEVARLPLSHFSFLQPQLEGQIGKAAFTSLCPCRRWCSSISSARWRPLLRRTPPLTPPVWRRCALSLIVPGWGPSCWMILVSVIEKYLVT